jgi:nucleoside-diphosphate-sugar epimerase
MKLVIGGATGFVGKELLKQALACPEFTSIVTLGRRPVTVKDSKLTDVVLDDLEQYPPSALQKIADADACIWYEYKKFVCLHCFGFC